MITIATLAQSLKKLTMGLETANFAATSNGRSFPAIKVRVPSNVTTKVQDTAKVEESKVVHKMGGSCVWCLLRLPFASVGKLEFQGMTLAKQRSIT